MTNPPTTPTGAPEPPDSGTRFCPDLIIGRHPVHGVLADGHINEVTAGLLEQAGFVYDEDLHVHRVPAGTSYEAGQDCVLRAMAVLAGRLPAVAYLSDDMAAEAAGSPRPQTPQA
ncbi:hypothetical protein ACFWD7_46770 [Streptomyces mirabilis]|uniref:hypothetical protein n=1 Tax=Streptomyces mirabilis TaxID=68239 RepID=UPI0036764536